MDSRKVPPPQTAVEKVREVLDSPEVARLVRTLEHVRWTGRKGYPLRAMVGMLFVKSLYAIPTWSRTVRLVAEHEALQRVLGAAPSQWACYRFARMLRERDNWALQQCIHDVIAAVREQRPEMGQHVAIDGSNMPAYANGYRTKHDGSPRAVSDPDASWAHRSAISTRKGGGYYGYKLHAVVDAATDLPIAWTIGSGKTWEPHFAPALIDAVKSRGFPVQTAAMDKIYDLQPIHTYLMNRGVAPITPLKETGAVKRGSEGKAPCCEHGEWKFAGGDWKRYATKWRCPTGMCKPGSKWVKVTRYRPLIPRETKRHRELYAARGCVEREFGRLKHEWALTPLRVRGLEAVRLHADLTILARLASWLAQQRALAVPLAA